MNYDRRGTRVASELSMATVMDEYVMRLVSELKQALTRENASPVTSDGGPDAGTIDAQFGPVSVRIAYEHVQGVISAGAMMYKTGKNSPKPRIDKSTRNRYGAEVTLNEIVRSLVKQALQFREL